MTNILIAVFTFAAVSMFFVPTNSLYAKVSNIICGSALVFGVLFKHFYFQLNNFDFVSISPEFLRINTEKYELALFISAAFSVGMLIGCFCANQIQGPRQVVIKDAKLQTQEKTVQYLLKFCFGFSVFLAILKMVLGVGQMGVESKKLPFLLDTIIFRCQSHLIPTLLIFCLNYGILYKNISIAKTSIGLLLFHYAQGLLTGSKSGVIFAVLIIFITYYIQGVKIVKNAIKFSPLIIFASLFMYCCGQAIRSDRMGINEDGVSITDGALQLFINPKDSIEYFFAIVNRVQGLDGLLIVLSSDSESLDLLYRLSNLISRNASDFYTKEIYNLGVENDFRAPGIIGFFSLMSANPWFIFISGFVLRLFFQIPLLIQSGQAKVTFLVACSIFNFSVLTEGYIPWQDFLSVFFSYFLIKQFLASKMIRNKLIGSG